MYDKAPHDPETVDFLTEAFAEAWQEARNQPGAIAIADPTQYMIASVLLDAVTDGELDLGWLHKIAMGAVSDPLFEPNQSYRSVPWPQGGKH
jgi:hypothetical protein